MPTNNERMSGAKAVDEATRTISENSDQATAYARRALSSATNFVSDAFARNPQLLSGGASDVEAALKASFGFQNAVLAALSPVLDASFGATKDVFTAYTTLVEHEQKVILSSWNRAADTLEQVAPTAK